MINIITIDGPASSGKGTVAKLVAQQLGFHYLDSGAIYRALSLLVIRANISANDVAAILKLIISMELSFKDDKVLLNGQDETDSLRLESVGMLASSIAKISEIRTPLLDSQRSFARPPGLVTDGRDMGSVVFPAASLKIFLTATAEKRASRRYSQLQARHNSVTIGDILRDITTRDMQDCKRSVAPLVWDSTYRVLDNSDMSIAATVETIINWYKQL